MRDILFRGKLASSGEWAFGLPGSDRTIIMASPRGNADEVAVLNGTVGQYAGKCDSKGDMIFEGDIVETSAPIIYTGPVTSRY